jgi:hypothetical protein
MNLLDVLPKDFMGYIILNPGGSMNGKPIEGYVDPEWVKVNYGTLAAASVPMTNEQLAELKAIDEYWSQNADRWRVEGLI